MSNQFQVSLSDKPIAANWGSKNTLAFTSEGATIHLSDLTDSPANMDIVQRAGRQLSGMKIPSIALSGDWSLEAQWHFWQGAFEPKNAPDISLASLDMAEKQILESRIQVFHWVRKLINETPEELSPEKLAQSAADFISKLAPDAVSYNIIKGDDLAKQGYVGIYGVGRGSTRPPALLTLEYCPKDCQDDKPAVALVGKGITFDSGGYSMKSSMGMLHMKSDMGGAATVAGALALAIANGLNRKVNLYLCCAENLVSGHAYKLSDILTYRNGVTVEVVNTDAEGRLVLADGLIDAQQSGAPIIIDAATLTGAAMVAVGDSFNALFAMDESLAESFNTLATKEFDPTWRLPLTKEYLNNCPSPYADTANSRPVPGGGPGGASNAAAFLSRFLEKPESGWLHLDLAACYKDAPNAKWSAGATGRGVRSIAAFLNQM